LHSTAAVAEKILHEPREEYGSTPGQRRKVVQ